MISEGAAVAIADINRDAANTTAIELGPDAFAVAVDVSDEPSVIKMVDAVIARFGSIDIVHNNAAALSLDVFGRDNGVIDMDVDVWDRTMAVNVRGPMLVCKHTIPYMLAGGRGAIVNTSSMSGLLGEDTHLAYACSKAAILAFTRHVANMHGRAGIRCNAVAPGLMLTDVALERLTPKQLEAFRAERLLPDASRPDDVANLVVFLASDQASCITGQTYVIDAGTQAQRPRAAMRKWEEYLSTPDSVGG
jgi:NAD(P)-dependent dehydrogenase (short-subunit alcohol dehydrogenase family)